MACSKPFSVPNTNISVLFGLTVPSGTRTWPLGTRETEAWAPFQKISQLSWLAVALVHVTKYPFHAEAADRVIAKHKHIRLSQSTALSQGRVSPWRLMMLRSHGELEPISTDSRLAFGFQSHSSPAEGSAQGEEELRGAELLPLISLWEDLGLLIK